MLGLVISLLVAIPASPVSASITCPQGPASCDAAAEPIAVVESSNRHDRLASAGSEGYATPAVIDCRVPVVSPVLLTLVGECDGATQITSRPMADVTDASYRASRYPESERPSGTLGPRRRDAGNKANVKISTCTGVPSEGGLTIAPTHTQPLALFSLPNLPPQESFTVSTPVDLLPPSGQLHPLERPPRA